MARMAASSAATNTARPCFTAAARARSASTMGWAPRTSPASVSGLLAARMREISGMATALSSDPGTAENPPRRFGGQGVQTPLGQSALEGKAVVCVLFRSGADHSARNVDVIQLAHALHQRALIFLRDGQRAQRPAEDVDIFFSISVSNQTRSASLHSAWKRSKKQPII
jgi:hypothetical protein